MSPRIEALAGELEALRAEIAELDAIEDATDEQTARYDAALAEWDTKKAAHDAAVVRAEKVEAVRSAHLSPANRESGFGAPAVHVKRDGFENVDALRHASNAEARDLALRTYEGKTRGISDEGREALLERIDTIPGVGKYALAHGTPEYRTAFSKWMDAAGNSPNYTADEHAAMDAAKLMRAALNITTGSSGQFSLPTVYDPSLIHTGTATRNPIRQLARVVQGTQNVWHGVSVGNVTTYWHAESAALTEGQPTLASPIITAGHLTGYLTGSWEFFDDSPMVAQLPGLIAEAFDYKESTAFVTGTGTSQPLGVVTAISATAGSTVTATTRGQFNSASAADLFAVVNALPVRYEDSAAWIANKATYNTIRQMSNSGAGGLFWDTLSGGVIDHPVLLGYPAYNSSDVLATTTTGTVLAVLGDFKQYVIYDVVGTQVEFMPQVVDGSGIPLGQRAIIARKRVGANTTDINAFRFLLA